MSTYKISLEQIRQNPEISEMLTALERGLQKFGIDFYLVGAVARDVWMNGINKIAPRRTTADIDFAVLINNKSTYDGLKSFLIANENFNSVKDNDFVLVWHGKFQVDLLPFSAVRNGQGFFIPSGNGFAGIDLQGFSEIYEQGLPEMELEGNLRFKFCTLPGIVLLKMISWEDRPEIRSEDIIDICDILNHYFEMHDEDIWTNHSDLFGDANIELKHVSARVIGREMKKIAKRNEKLFERIEKLLIANTEDLHKSKMGEIMIRYFGNTVQDNIQLLLELKKGFLE